MLDECQERNKGHLPMVNFCLSPLLLIRFNAQKPVDHRFVLSFPSHIQQYIVLTMFEECRIPAKDITNPKLLVRNLRKFCRSHSLQIRSVKMRNDEYIVVVRRQWDSDDVAIGFPFMLPHTSGHTHPCVKHVRFTGIRGFVEGVFEVIDWA